MKGAPATLVVESRIIYGDRDFAEVVVWQVPEPVPPSEHRFKYRLAYIVRGQRVIGFDNERGKGDHWHNGDQEKMYEFRGIDQLLADFADAVDLWRNDNGKN